MNLRAAAAAACTFALLLAPWSAPAQNTGKNAPPPYALIFGTVYAPDDTPVYGATVHIQRADGRKVKNGELRSDHHGEFALRVPPGEADYLVRAELKSGNKKKLTAESKVHVSNDERVDVGLHLRE